MLKVNLNSINDVKKFVNTTYKCECDITLCSGKYVIDAKSIMGVFSLDLSKPIDLIIETDDELIRNKVIDRLKYFLLN